MPHSILAGLLPPNLVGAASSASVGPPPLSVSHMLSSGAAFSAVTPPINFAHVADGVMRSAYPTELRHVAFLKQQCVKTVVALSIESMPCFILTALLAKPPSSGHRDSPAETPRVTTDGAVGSSRPSLTSSAGLSVLHMHLDGCEYCRGRGGSFTHQAAPDADAAHQTASWSSNASFCGVSSPILASDPSHHHHHHPNGSGSSLPPFSASFSSVAHLHNQMQSNRGGEGSGAAHRDRRHSSNPHEMDRVGPIPSTPSHQEKDALCVCGRQTKVAAVRDVLDIVLDASYHPVLLCCPSGERESSLVVACLRRMQRWSLAAILQEVDTFASAASSGNSRSIRFGSLLHEFHFDAGDARWSDDAFALRKHSREEALRQNAAVGDSRGVLRYILTGGRNAGPVTNSNRGGMLHAIQQHHELAAAAGGAGGPHGSSQQGRHPNMGAASINPEPEALPPSTHSGTVTGSGSHHARLRHPHDGPSSGDSSRGWCGQERAAQAAARLWAFVHNKQQGSYNVHHHQTAAAQVSPGLQPIMAALHVSGDDHDLSKGESARRLPASSRGSWTPSSILIEARRWAIDGGVTVCRENLPNRLRLYADSQSGAPPSAPHEHFWGVRNPPLLDPRSTFSKTDSLVEEDDD